MQIAKISFLIAVLLQPGLAQANYYQGKTVVIIWHVQRTDTMTTWFLEVLHAIEQSQ